MDQAFGSALTAYRDALRLALSSIVLLVSRQMSDTCCGAINKDVSAEDVFALSLRTAARFETRELNHNSEGL